MSYTLFAESKLVLHYIENFSFTFGSRKKKRNFGVLIICKFLFLFPVDWTKRIRLWHCERKYSYKWSRNRRCFRWWETYRRRKRIWIWRLEAIHEEIHHYHQSFQRFASSARHQIWISRIKKMYAKKFLLLFTFRLLRKKKHQAKE